MPNAATSLWVAVKRVTQSRLPRKWRGSDLVSKGSDLVLCFSGVSGRKESREDILATLSGFVVEVEFLPFEFFLRRMANCVYFDQRLVFVDRKDDAMGEMQKLSNVFPEGVLLTNEPEQSKGSGLFDLGAY